MRIGIDARELTGRPTGVGRYLAALLREWNTVAVAAPIPHEFVLYAPAHPRHAALAELAALCPAVSVVPGHGGTWWEQVSLPSVVNGDRLDVLFAPAYTAPLRIACPSVLTIHDLSYLAHPEWYRPRERWRRAFFTRAAARRASAILTDSTFSMREVCRLIPVSEDRITVIPLGLGMSAPPATIAREPLVLFVGSIFNRRRVPDLVEAFGVVARDRPDVRLEIVGENRTWPHEDIGGLVRAQGLDGRATLHAYVEDDDLARRYARASVFVFLSEYEGFGLTPLEALASQVPIVVLDTAIAREIYEDAAIYVRPGDIPATARAITELVAGGPARARILAAAASLLPRYSWPRTAARTLAAIEGGAR